MRIVAANRSDAGERSGWLSLFCLLAFATFGWRFIAGLERETWIHVGLSGETFARSRLRARIHEQEPIAFAENSVSSSSQG